MTNDSEILDDNDHSIETRAPGLFRELKRICNESSLPQFALVFSKAYDANKLLEPTLTRPAQANYNCRPARIAQILITELKERNEHTLLAAILACGGSSALNDRSLLASGDLHNAIELASKVQNGLCDCEASERISLAIKIDELRHLHMRVISTEQKLLEVETITAQLRPPAFSSNTRLHALAKASLDRIVPRQISCFRSYQQGRLKSTGGRQNKN